MASQETLSNENDFIKVMETFPCLFNVGTMRKPSHTRLRVMIRTLNIDLEHEDVEQRQIIYRNVLSWIYFQVGDLETAKSNNDEALRLSANDLVTLGNQAFLEWYSGSNLSKFLADLEKLKLEKNFLEWKLNAKASQANLLFRLGGHCNMSASLQMYDALVREQPHNFEWKYYLGLAHRRLNVMNRNTNDEKKIAKLFEDVSENATDPYWKCAALGELALLVALHDAPVRVVQNLVGQARNLRNDDPIVLRQCGMALKRLGSPKAIELLEMSVSLLDNTVTQHTLAKAYADYKLTRHLDSRECDRKAAKYFKASYEFSGKENVRPLLDLGFLHLRRKQYSECMDIYRDLIQIWSVKEVFNNPFLLAKIFEGWYQILKNTSGRTTPPLFDRYLSIALLTSLEQFNHESLIEDKSLLFDVVLNPSTRVVQNGSAKSVVHLLKDCNNERCARKILMNLHTHARLDEKECVTREVDLLLENDKPGEALLILEMYALQEHGNLSKKLHHKAMMEEAKWQLEKGLVSCKLLFHKMFNINHSYSDDKEDNNETNARTPEADVLILKDGHHWKPFLQKTTGPMVSSKTNVGIVPQNQVYDDVLEYLFDLQILTNPWLPFLEGNRPDAEAFSALLNQFSVQLVLVIMDEDTTEEFLQMANDLLSKNIQHKDIDLAIICSKGDLEEKAKKHLTNSTGKVRIFKAEENGVVHREDARPVDDLVGTQILDAYFSGKVDNAIKFFEFLAPAV